jgi:hypothetical protein
MADKDKNPNAGEENIEDTLYDKETPEKEEEETPEKKEPEKKEPEKKEEKVPEKKEPEKKEEASKYELKLPEGSPLAAEDLERIATFAKEHGLSDKAAQAVVDRESKLLTEHADSQKKVFESETADWEKRSKEDKEFGGDNLKSNTELAKRVIQRYGSEALVKGLEATRFGNHPELIRMLVRIGKAMTDDQLVQPGKGSAAKKEMADIFYGGSQNNNE